MGSWITINGSHIFLKDGQSVEEALAERKAGTGTKDSHKQINDNLRNAFNKSRQKEQEKTHEVVSQMRMPSVRIPDELLENETFDLSMSTPEEDKAELERLNKERPDFQIVGYTKINMQMIESELIDENTSDEVILSKFTAENHVFLRHGDIEKYMDVIFEAIKHPNEIYEVEDEKRTGKKLGFILYNSVPARNHKNAMLVIVRPNNKNDKEHYQSSIRTAHSLSKKAEKRFKNSAKHKLIMKLKNGKIK